MSAEANRCSKCNGEMVQGFLFKSEGHRLDTWVEGTPEKSWWGARRPRRKSASRWAPSGVRCADSWNPMRGQSSARNNAASPVLRSFSRLAIWHKAWLGITSPERRTAEQTVQPEPQAARFLKSTLVGRGPVNRVVEHSGDAEEAYIA